MKEDGLRILLNSGCRVGQHTFVFSGGISNEWGIQTRGGRDEYFIRYARNSQLLSPGDPYLRCGLGVQLLAPLGVRIGRNLPSSVRERLDIRGVYCYRVSEVRKPLTQAVSESSHALLHQWLELAQSLEKTAIGEFARDAIFRDNTTREAQVWIVMERANQRGEGRQTQNIGGKVGSPHRLDRIARPPIVTCSFQRGYQLMIGQGFKHGLKIFPQAGKMICGHGARPSLFPYRGRAVTAASPPLFNYLVAPARLELATSDFARAGSVRLSYGAGDGVVERFSLAGGPLYPFLYRLPPPSNGNASCSIAVQRQNPAWSFTARC